MKVNGVHHILYMLVCFMGNRVEYTAMQLMDNDACYFMQKISHRINWITFQRINCEEVDGVNFLHIKP